MLLCAVALGADTDDSHGAGLRHAAPLGGRLTPFRALDPTGEKARAVKARYVGVCRGCGAYTQPRNGKGDAYAYCNSATPARSSAAGPAIGCSRGWPSGDRATGGCRRPTTGRARTRVGVGETRSHASPKESGLRRVSSRTSSERGRPPARPRGRTWRRGQLRPGATASANRAGSPALLTVGAILPPGFDSRSMPPSWTGPRTRRHARCCGPVLPATAPRLARAETYWAQFCARVRMRAGLRGAPQLQRRSLRRGSRSDSGDVRPRRVRPSGAPTRCRGQIVGDTGRMPSMDYVNCGDG